MAHCHQCGRRLGKDVLCPLHGEKTDRPPHAKDALPLLPVEPLSGEYKLIRPLGHGGFATVYEATRVSDGLQAAIKAAPANDAVAAKALHWEAEVLKAIGPGPVPDVYEVHAATRTFLVMELLTGRTLADHLSDKRELLPQKEVYRLAVELLKALVVVHRAGFVHADLKPENVWLTGSRVRLIDLGTAQRLPAPSDFQSAPPTTDLLVGTTEYLSPEAIEGHSLDVMADIYAFGVMLYELLTGTIPFFGADAEVKQAHLERRVPQMPDALGVPKAIEDLTVRCLAKQPRERWSNVVMLLRALREAIRDAPAPLAVKAPVEDTDARGEVITTPFVPVVAAPGRGKREQVLAALVFVPAECGVFELGELLKAYGGLVGSTTPLGHVGLFTHEAASNPARRALLAAQEIIAKGMATQLRLDVAEVLYKELGRGRKRYSSPLFARPEAWPAPSDGPGFLLTAAVVSAHGACRAVPSETHPNLLRLVEENLTERSAASNMFDAALIGRDAELDQAVFHGQVALETGKAALATVVGDAGLGKSRFGDSLRERLKAAVPEARWIALRAEEPAGNNAEVTLRALLREVFQLGPGAQQEEGQQVLVDCLGEEVAEDLLPAVAVALGWYKPDHPEVQGLAPGVLRERSSLALRRGLHALTRRSPVVVLLDDAQWAGDVTLEGLELATLARTDAPLWVIVLARPSFEKLRPTWAERSAQPLKISLGPLDVAAASELCRQLLLPATFVPSATVKALVERAGGIPLLLVELVRTLKRQGLVRQRSGEQAWFVATDEVEQMAELPLVDWVARRELESLRPELAAHARLCAMLSDFTDAEVSGILQRLRGQEFDTAFPMEGRAGNQRLKQEGVLVSRDNGTLGFRHALVREAVARTVPEGHLVAIHRAAFDYYRHTTEAPSALAKAARHAAAAGLRDEALVAHQQLAAEAQARQRFSDAEYHHSQVLQLAGPQALNAQLEALRGRGLMRYRLGRYSDSAEDLNRACDVARAHGRKKDEIELLLDAATAYDWMNDFGRSASLVAQARALAGQQPGAFLQARLLVGEGRTDTRFDHFEQAIEKLLMAAKMTEGMGDEAYETRVVALLLAGGVGAVLGHAERAASAFDALMPLLIEKGDTAHLGGAYNNRAYLWAITGDAKRLEEDGLRSIELAREQGSPTIEINGLAILSETLLFLYEFEAAEKYARRALELEQSGHRHTASVQTRTILARVLARRPETVAEARRELMMIRAIPSEQIQWTPGEQVLTHLVDLATRPATEEEWDSLWSTAKDCTTAFQRVEILAIRADAIAMSDPEQAVRHLEMAKQLANTFAKGPVIERLEERIVQLREELLKRDVDFDLGLNPKPVLRTEISTATQLRKGRQLGLEHPLVLISPQRRWEPIGGLALIGRDPRCHIHLPLLSISRFHVAIYRFGREFHMRDLGSKNGSLVNGRPVESVALREGDLIEAGGQSFRVTSADEPLQPYSPEACVLFVDLANSTALSAKHGTPFVHSLKNLLLRFVDLALVHQGCPIKTLGDGLLVVFGIWPRLAQPRSPGNDAREYFEACVALTEARGAEIGIPLIIRAGAALGPVSVTDGQGLDVVGDTVNFASRLEALNKEYGTRFMLNEALAQSLGEGKTRELDTVRVRGNDHPMNVFTLTKSGRSVPQATETLSSTRALGQVEEHYQAGLHAYRAGEFEAALGHFSAAAHDDGPSEVMRRRSLELKDRALKNWEGVWTFS